MIQFFNKQPVRFEEREGVQYITGYASVFYDGSPETEYQPYEGVKVRIHRKAFTTAFERGDDTKAYYNHDPNYLLGRVASGTLKLRVDNHGLRYDIVYDPHDPDHQYVKRKLEKRDVVGSSFAITVNKESWTREGDHDVQTLEDFSTLIDVGPVTDPAFSGTSAALFAADNSGSVKASHERWLQQQETNKRLERLNNITR